MMTSQHVPFLPHEPYPLILAHALDPAFIKQLTVHFENLKPDEFNSADKQANKEKGVWGRHRAYGEISCVEDKYIQLPPRPFTQSQDINQANGGVNRWFPELDAALVADDVFVHLVKHFHRHMLDGQPGVLGIHFIRTNCVGVEGAPAPEGPHRDGFDKVGMLTVNRHNISGGRTQLLPQLQEGDPKCDEVLLDSVLEESQVLIINDEHYRHNVTAITADDPKQKAFRDVIVVTSSFKDLL